MTFISKSVNFITIQRPHTLITHLGTLDGNPSLYSDTTQAPPSPRLCCSPNLAPGTCLRSASPLSCQHSSAHWARPVAPRGWPLEMSPPLGLMTYLPPYVLSPRSIISPALPVYAWVWIQPYNHFNCFVYSIILKASSLIDLKCVGELIVWSHCVYTKWKRVKA